MSLRTALRFVLVALLVVTLVGPATAQVAVAPMPRTKPTREIRLGLSVGGPQVVQVQYQYLRLDTPDVAPMPREVPTENYNRIFVLGNNGKPDVLELSSNKGQFDKGQTFSLSVGLFGGTGSDEPMPQTGPRRVPADFDPVIEEILLGRPTLDPAFRAAVPAPPHCAFDRCAQPTQSVARPLSGTEVHNLTWHYNPPMPRAIVEVIGAENPACIPGTTRCGNQLSLIPAYPHGAYRATCSQPSPITGCKPAGDIVVYEIQNCDPRLRAKMLSQLVPMPRTIVNVVGEFQDTARRQVAGNDFFIELGYRNDEPPLYAVFRPAPAMIPARPLSVPAHPLVEFRAIRCDGNECWWMEPMRVPMPRTLTREHEFTCVGPGPIPCVEVRGHPHGVAAGGPAPCFQTPAAKSECCPVPAITHPIVLRQLGLQPAQPALTKCPAETWYREIDGVTISATFSGSEMTVRLVQCVENLTMSFTITGDFAVTKEGVVHGVVTGVDADVKVGMRTHETRLPGLEVAKAVTELQKKLIDSPFCFRVKQTSSGMMVSSFRIGCEDFNSSELALACGMYKLAPEGRVPAAKPMETWLGGLTGCDSPKCSVSDPGTVLPAGHATPPLGDPGLTPPAAPGSVMPQPTPPGEVVPVKEMSEQLRKVLGLKTPYLTHYPQYYAPDPIHPLPRELAVIEDAAGSTVRCAVPQAVCPPMLCPPKPTNVPANEFGMMAEVFGQMMGQPNGQCQAPPVSTYSVQLAGMTHPAPMAMPMPVASSVAVSPVMGTWYREVGPRMCVVKIEPDHLTLSFSESEEVEGGKTATSGVTLTCDYHLSRDGVTAVGLITCVDALVEGEFPADAAKDLLDFVAAFQKTCEEKPFALTLRPYGDSLVVGNVRMPEIGDAAEIQPSSMFGGRYKKASEKGVPKPKPMKAGTAKAASQDLRQIHNEWRRFWFADQPSHITPEQLHGTQRLGAATSGRTGTGPAIGSGVAYPTLAEHGPIPTVSPGSTTPIPNLR